ncbi:Ankyrin repeat domain containing protein [Pandoravirus macleodensis]|uniref:Ankyrin repeat domain containing protein n=1 Tax=Pandoravirus macleodensis TaxID=2107707 RepID=A0A2U7UFR3_9VIRU|nr:Ankyrin repeat domain containing protein [Pandoravirus macleodensis]AVK77150.1 Ankyrin repeat domain containing protein [Pandoravirus macleodensis]
MELVPSMIDLPAEIICAIFDHLEPVDRFVCALVSPAWGALVKAYATPLSRRKDDDWELEPRLHQRHTFLAGACRCGRLDLVRWAVAEGCPRDGDAFVDAVHCGHIDILAWLQSAGCPRSIDRCLVAAADGGHVALVHVFLCHQRSVATAVRSGSERDHSHVTSRASLEHAIRRAVYRGHLHALKVLLEDGRIPSTVAWIAAAIVGDTNLFEWLHDNGYNVPCDASAHAAAHGHIDALEWLRKRGHLYTSGCYISAVLANHAHVVDWVMPWRTPGWLDHAASVLAAARHGRPDPLLHLPFRDYERLAVEAARNGNLGMMLSIMKRGNRVSRMQILAAAYGGHTHIMEWASSAGIQLSGLVTAIAAVRGHRETAQFCEQNCRIKMAWEFNEPIWQGFALASDRPLFRFGPRRHALDMALSYGDANTVAHLLEGLPICGRISRSAFRLAVATRNLVIVPPLARCASPRERRRAWREAASLADIAMLKRLRDACGWPDCQTVQDLFLHAACSPYGWRAVFEWLAWAGMRCDSATMSKLTSARPSVPRDLVAWTSVHWRP